MGELASAPERVSHLQFQNRSITHERNWLALVCALVTTFSLASCGLSTPDTVGKVGDFEVSSGLYLLAQFSAYQQGSPSWPITYQITTE